MQLSYTFKQDNMLHTTIISLLKKYVGAFGQQDNVSAKGTALKPTTMLGILPFFHNAEGLREA